MKKNQIGIVPEAAASPPVTGMMKSNSLFTRREMLELTGVAGLATFTGIALDAVAQTAQKRPRIACLVSYWGLPTSHADWIVNKLLDGYWWQGAHTPSRVEVVSVYIHQLDTSLLGKKVCKAKNIPIFKTVIDPVAPYTSAAWRSVRRDRQRCTMSRTAGTICWLWGEKSTGNKMLLNCM